MQSKNIIQSQYHASLAMLRQAIEKCPDALWADAAYVNPFWRVAYHAIFYTHLYLQRTYEDFVPWEKHRDRINYLAHPAKGEKPYSKAELLEYLDLCSGQVSALVDDLDLEAESSFDRLPFNKLELQVYNIRHLQHHTGELCERLGAHGEIEVAWVAMQG